MLPVFRRGSDTFIRAGWQKRRLQLVEADLFRTVLAENPGAGLAAAMFSAAKLLARIQRQFAAFERAWFRAHRDFHRGRAKSVDGEMAVLDALMSAPMPAPHPLFRPKLASFPPTEQVPQASDPITAPEEHTGGHTPFGR